MLGDARSRLVKLVERLAEQPSMRIPAARAGTAETKAAYRLVFRLLLLGQEYSAWHGELHSN